MGLNVWSSVSSDLKCVVKLLEQSLSRCTMNVNMWSSTYKQLISVVKLQQQKVMFGGAVAGESS